MSDTVTPETTRTPSSPYGLHRVVLQDGERPALPQAARRLDARPEIWPDEVRVDVETLNLDAASYRQLREAYGTAGVRQAVLDIVAERGKMQNPVTGSGGCSSARSPRSVRGRRSAWRWATGSPPWCR